MVCRKKRVDVYDIYRLVNANQAELPVRALCETLKVSTSGYDDWRDRPLSKRAQASIVLNEHIRRAHRASDETYGMPRIRAALADVGVIASRKGIARLMRAMRIQGVSRRRAWCVTTQRNQRQRPAPDLVKRVFVAQDINELWVADMTYVPTWEGFLHLAVVTDACSRKVVGWAFGVQMTADLVIAALNMALHTRKPEAVIHHSDQGSQLGFKESSQRQLVEHQTVRWPGPSQFVAVHAGPSPRPDPTSMTWPTLLAASQSWPQWHRARPVRHDRPGRGRF